VRISGVKTAHVTLSKISKEDSGMFTCRANNSAGITEKQIDVIVKCESICYLQAICLLHLFILNLLKKKQENKTKV